MTDPLAFNPPVGVAETVAQGVRRILAPNPSPMTFRGTNTYLVGTRSLAVIDPGPDIARHLAAIRAAVGPSQRIDQILVTHAHLDHSPLARRLADLTGAPVLAFGPADAGRSAAMTALAEAGLAGGGEGIDAAFTPGARLADGTVIEGDGWRLQALWTPGHLSNHMVFALGDIVFSGDLVMGWSTSLVSPPDGDMGAYMRSCARLLRRRDRRHLPGHGAPVEDPGARLAEILAHRQGRENAIRAALDRGPATVPMIQRGVYPPLSAGLVQAAERNVLAHLLDLCERGVAKAEPQPSDTAMFRLV